EGVLVGRYRIRGILGRGGMGVVYEAEDPELGRRVALKVLRAQLGKIAGARLLAEARAMAGVSDPNVCAVYDVGALDGRHYLAMECIPEGTLLTWLAAKRRTTPEIVAAFVGAGQGLAAAHAIGVVHRDFKPTNVLVDGRGRVLVCDFGLAATSQDPCLAAGGTPRYMAPEQRSDRADERVDQFAFGVALADALVGRRVPWRLRRVIDRARREDPAARFGSMRALLAALRVHARPASPTAAVGLGAAASVLGLIVAAGQPGRLHAGAPPEAIRSAPAVEPGVEGLIDAAERYGASQDATRMRALCDEALKRARALGDPAGIALALRHRGSLLGKVGEPAQAVADLREAFYRATQVGRDDIAADAAMIVVGLLATDLGDPEGALTWGRHAEGSMGRLDALPARLRADFDDVMGRVHKSLGEPAAARTRLQRAVATLRAASPELDLLLPIKLGALAGAERSQGDLVSARAHVEEAIAISTSLEGARSATVGALLSDLGSILAEQGAYEESLQTLIEAREIVVAAYDDRHTIVIGIDASRASALMKLRRFDDAMLLLEDTLPRAQVGAPFRCEVLERMAATRARQHRCDEARRRYHTAIDCWEDVYGPGTHFAQRALQGRTVCSAGADSGATSTGGAAGGGAIAATTG
ncbi:MAG: serine/threonine-protein kinase, partial [Myxococcota bacterium]